MEELLSLYRYENVLIKTELQHQIETHARELREIQTKHKIEVSKTNEMYSPYRGIIAITSENNLITKAVAVYLGYIYY